MMMMGAITRLQRWLSNMLLPNQNLPFWQEKDLLKENLPFDDGKSYSLSALKSMCKSNGADPNSLIWREGAALKFRNAYYRVWFDLSHYIIDDMLSEEGVYLGMAYHLDMPPTRPPEIYTDQG